MEGEDCFCDAVDSQFGCYFVAFFLPTGSDLGLQSLSSAASPFFSPDISQCNLFGTGQTCVNHGFFPPSIFPTSSVALSCLDPLACIFFPWKRFPLSRNQTGDDYLSVLVISPWFLTELDRKRYAPLEEYELLYDRQVGMETFFPSPPFLSISSRPKMALSPILFLRSFFFSPWRVGPYPDQQTFPPSSRTSGNRMLIVSIRSFFSLPASKLFITAAWLF